MARRRFRPWPVLLWVVWCAPAAALTPRPDLTRYRHQEWRTKDGLPSDVVRAVLQTHDGYVWVGTQEGAAHFDGVKFVTPADEGARVIAASGVSALRETRAGVLWAGTNGAGLARITGEAVTPFGTSDGVPHGYVRDLAEDPQGRLWVGTAVGLGRMVDGHPLRLPPAHPAAAVNVRALAPTGDGAVWVGTRWGLLRADAAGATAAGGETPARTHMVRALLAEADGTLWAGTDAGLVQGRGGAWRTFTTPDGLPDPVVTALLRDRGGVLWIATKGGVAWLDGERVRPTAVAGVCEGAVVALADDDQGGLWTGTDGCGVHRFSDGVGHMLTGSDGLGDLRVAALAAAPDGTFWLASRDGALRHWAPPAAAQAVALPDAARGGEIADLGVAASGTVWVVMRDGRVFRGRGDAFVAYGPAQGATVTCALETRAGEVWLCTGAPNRFLLVRGDRVEPVEVAVGRPTVAYQGASGTVWLGGSTAVARREGAGWRSFGLLGAEAWTVAEDHAGTAWVGTSYSGIRRIAGGRVSAIDDRQGLPARRVFGLVEDRNGELWFVGSKGVFHASIDDLNQVADGRRADIAAALYGPEDQIVFAPEPYGRPMVAVGKDGALMFATKHGVAAIVPGQVRASERPARVLVEEVLVDGARVAERPVARGPVHGQVEIRYTALEFAAPGRVAFRHRLAPADGAWVEAGPQRFVRYPALPPGRYRFEVQARGSDGRWGPAQAVALTFAPPFHRTPLFYGLATVALALGAGSLHRLRLAQADARHRAVLADRERIAKDIHDTLGQTFAAISLQTECLDRAMRTGDAPVVEHLDEIRSLVATGISEARRSVLSLRPDPLVGATLADAIRSAGRRLEGGARIDVVVEGQERPLAEPAEDALYRVAQESLTNAIRHAGARSIEVRLRYRAGGVALVVQDDGRGFAPGNRAGQGLRGMRDRAAAIGARLQVESGPEGTTIQMEVDT